MLRTFSFLGKTLCGALALALALAMAGALASAHAEAPPGVSAEIDAAIARHNQTITQAVARADAERVKRLADTLAELRTAAAAARREGKESDALSLEHTAAGLAAPKLRRTSAFYTLDDFVGPWRWENNRTLRISPDGTWRLDDTGQTGRVELCDMALKLTWTDNGIAMVMLPDRPPANHTYLVITHGGRYLVTKTGPARATIPARSATSAPATPPPAGASGTGKIAHSSSISTASGVSPRTDSAR